MKFGMYATDRSIDLRLPSKNDHYSSMKVRQKEIPLKLGLFRSSCRNFGPIWIKFGVFRTDINPI